MRQVKYIVSVGIRVTRFRNVSYGCAVIKVEGCMYS